ncbi:MAG: hypothetical protein L3J28_08560 [Candidatus Polarisedimenticolaceae bacterium]|nr:hypothetical protein [Candidatus Polarisedimenticolaceae bacterium]
MNFSIVVGQDQTASLINRAGEVLWTFPNLVCARKACQDWYATPEQVAQQPLFKQATGNIGSSSALAPLIGCYVTSAAA